MQTKYLFISIFLENYLRLRLCAFLFIFLKNLGKSLKKKQKSNYCKLLWEGVKKNEFLGDISPKLWTPPPLSPLTGQKKIKKNFFSFFRNILLEPILRLGVTIQKNVLIKRFFMEMLNIFYILSENSRLFWRLLHFYVQWILIFSTLAKRAQFSEFNVSPLRSSVLNTKYKNK